MKQYSTMTAACIFEAYKKGQRHFPDLDFEYENGFADTDLSGCIFEDCFLYLDFRNTDLSNTQFIGCNIIRT